MSHPGAMKDFYFDKIKEEDLEKLEALASETNFQVGLENRRICFSLSPDEYFFIRTKSTNELVGFICNHIMTEDLYLRYQVYIRPKFRTGGTLHIVGEALWAFRFKNYQGNFFYCCNNKSLQASIRHYPGEIIGPKIVTYGGTLNKSMLGTINPCIPDGVTVRVVKTEADLALVQQYDSQVNPVSREKFLDKWCRKSEYGWTVVALKNNTTCLGFVSLRKWAIENEYWISMGYSESPELLQAMMKELLGHLPLVADIFFGFPAKQRCMVELCSKLGLTWIYAEHRVYGREEVKIPWEKVFVCHEYFLI